MRRSETQDGCEWVYDAVTLLATRSRGANSENLSKSKTTRYEVKTKDYFNARRHQCIIKFKT